ncbi:MAG: peptide deformylase [Candidatus Bipolaricaulaceae bacterium]
MIRIYPDPILRRRARPVRPGSAEAEETVRRLTEAFSQVEALGLAANQVGALARVIVVRLGEDEQTYVVLNPQVVSRSAELTEDSEGCLSLPGVEADVPRPQEVVVRGQSPTGKPLELAAAGVDARVVQHEIDHLDGVLYVDHLPVDRRRAVLRAFRRRQAALAATPANA